MYKRCLLNDDNEKIIKQINNRENENYNIKCVCVCVFWCVGAEVGLLRVYLMSSKLMHGNMETKENI